MAIKEIDSTGIPAGREAAKLYISYDGKKYPAKYVVSLAGKYALGCDYCHKHLAEVRETTEFLKSKGFTIILKNKYENKPLALMLKARTEMYENIYLSFVKYGRTWIRLTSPIGKKFAKLCEETIEENGYLLAFGYEQKPVHKINYMLKIDNIFTDFNKKSQLPDYTAPEFYKRHDTDHDKLFYKVDYKYASLLSVSHVEIVNPMDPCEFTNYSTSETLNITIAAHYYINTPVKYINSDSKIINAVKTDNDNPVDSELNSLQEQDAKTKTMTSIDYRLYQMKFRQCLLAVYEGKCAITGCDVSDALEAAHITPYMGDKTNDVQNGLLLRADIQTLFDLGKITISPKDLRVILHRDLCNTHYSTLQGKKISVPKMKSDWPSRLALEVHRKSSGL